MHSGRNFVRWFATVLSLVPGRRRLAEVPSASPEKVVASVQPLPGVGMQHCKHRRPAQCVSPDCGNSTPTIRFAVAQKRRVAHGAAAMAQSQAGTPDSAQRASAIELLAWRTPALSRFPAATTHICISP